VIAALNIVEFFNNQVQLAEESLTFINK